MKTTDRKHPFSKQLRTVVLLPAAGQARERHQQDGDEGLAGMTSAKAQASPPLRCVRA